jgi:hypothetical protein
MFPASRRACGRIPLGLLLILSTLPARAQETTLQPDALDIVAVGIVNDGESILLATPGLPKDGRTWRFRSLDTSTLPQPIEKVVLASTGTKLFVQSVNGTHGILDLTRQQRHHATLQYVSARDITLDEDLSRQAHALPAQRFVAMRDGVAYVIDDMGRVRSEYPAIRAVDAAICDDGTVLYVGADGRLSACGDDKDDRKGCRQLPGIVNTASVTIAARSVGRADGSRLPRFLLIEGGDGDASVLDPEGETFRSASTDRVDAALRACLRLSASRVSEKRIAAYVNTLLDESARTAAAAGRRVARWQFFHVAPDPDLYAPVLELAPLETVFPSTFDTLEKIVPPGLGSGAVHVEPDALYDRYLRQEPAERRAQCTFYFHTKSTPGSWLIEYWLYYPFDVGGLGSHPHDPEHLFVEVEKLGGTVRRVIGAGHGYMAGNNVYTADKPGAHALNLPLFAIVELGKHATAPDIDRDGVFTPGVDENEYRERAKIWGVRDVIGTINNQVLAYDTTMSSTRRPEDWLAPAAFTALFPHESGLASRASCRATGLPAKSPLRSGGGFHLSDWVIVPPCHDLTPECAQRHVTEHPDFTDPATVLKEWAFPESFLRATYGLGPRRGLHSIGLGYAMDLDRVPGLGRALPLPGRLGADVFYWRQDTNESDRDSCLAKCEHGGGVGWAVRYEQFLSNLFGIFSAVRVYSPPIGDAWITFGPFLEAPLGKHTNVTLAGGLSFRPYASPRFELRLSAGLWKPKTNHLGLHAGSDERRR